MILNFIYRLIKVDRQWFKAFLQMIMLKAAFKHRNNDSCFGMHINYLVIVIIIIYVNDVLTIRGRK